MTQTLPSWMVEADPVPVTTPADTTSATWPAMVIASRRLANGVIGLELEPADGRVVNWTPGAHIDVHLPAGVGRPGQLVRQYSLCGKPGAATLEIAVLRESDGRGGSAFIHDAAAVGDVLFLGGPRNNFELEASPAYEFVAGGIGITPLLPMIAEVRARGAQWRLTYGGRSRSTMAFVEDLANDPRVRVVSEDTDGLLDLAEILAEVRPGCQVYCCGPEGLVTAVEDAARHWPAGSVHVERFRPRDDLAALPQEEFEVLLARSDTTVRVPAGKSILDTIAEAGVDVPASCREGTCGTCETDVVSGQVDHRDSLLTEADKTSGTCMMICVSRAAPGQRLVLDL